MIISYEEFSKKINEKIKNGPEFYYELLVNIIKNPNRYIGDFRLTTIGDKLLPNVSQSREIKFGDFMEEIVTDYINRLGFLTYEKNFATDDYQNLLRADQIFSQDDIYYLVEQKIRDDHDSSKKRGQYENFKNKITALRKIMPDKKISASIWFIDSNLKKNRNFYLEEMQKENSANLSLNLFYGSEFFNNLLNRTDAWSELVNHIRKYKKETNDDLIIPNFDTDPEILVALKRLKEDEPKLLERLLSQDETYILLRSQLFPTEHNLKMLNNVKKAKLRL